MGIGFLVAPRVSPEPPNLRVQIQLGFASVAVLAGAWVWGLRIAAAG
jgi:hypothetical protein